MKLLKHTHTQIFFSQYFKTNDAKEMFGYTGESKGGAWKQSQTSFIIPEHGVSLNTYSWQELP